MLLVFCCYKNCFNKHIRWLTHLTISPRHISGIKTIGFTTMSALHLEKLCQIVSVMVPMTMTVFLWTFSFLIDAFTCLGACTLPSLIVYFHSASFPVKLSFLLSAGSVFLFVCLFLMKLRLVVYTYKLLIFRRLRWIGPRECQASLGYKQT